MREEDIAYFNLRLYIINKMVHTSLYIWLLTHYKPNYSYYRVSYSCYKVSTLRSKSVIYLALWAARKADFTICSSTDGYKRIIGRESIRISYNTDHWTRFCMAILLMQYLLVKNMKGFRSARYWGDDNLEASISTWILYRYHLLDDRGCVETPFMTQREVIRMKRSNSSLYRLIRWL